MTGLLVTIARACFRALFSPLSLRSGAFCVRSYMGPITIFKCTVCYLLKPEANWVSFFGDMDAQFRDLKCALKGTS